MSVVTGEWGRYGFDRSGWAKNAIRRVVTTLKHKLKTINVSIFDYANAVLKGVVVKPKYAVA